MTRLDQYRGPLTPENVADGITAATRNARDLLSDAEALLEHRSYPRAAALAALAIEEAGKESILRDMAVVSDDEQLRKAWKAYRSHTRKNVMWTLLELVRGGARQLDDLRPLFAENAEHPHVLDQLKQLGLYTDCLGDGQWSEPREVIGEDLARSLVGVASIFARDRAVTTREIELWVELVGPARDTDLASQKRAVAKWYLAMQAEGLRPASDTGMEEFLFGSSIHHESPNAAGESP